MSTVAQPVRVGPTAVLRAPGVAPVFAASLIGRLPMGAIGLVLILRVRDLTGSYAAGGLAAGSYALANGLSAPLLGRLADRRGQPAVLLPSAALCMAALAAFAALPHGVAIWVAVALAALAGTGQPPLSACLRALWPTLLGDRDRQHAAFALEAAVMEVVYILGPLVIVGVVASASTVGAALLCGALTLAGAAMFATRGESRAWRPEPRGAHSGPFAAIGARGVRMLVVLMALCGLGLGAIEVAVPAFVEAAGRPNATGPVLALWGAGSLAGGLVAGRFGAPRNPVRRLVVLMLALGAAQVPLAFAPGVTGLAALIFLAGVPIAPSFAALFSLVGDVARPGTLTEAYTWVATGITAGFACGSALGGLLVESADPGWGFALAAAGGVATAIAAWTGRRALH